MHITHDKKGFSLIEITVAVIVLGVITAVAVPSYTSCVQQGAQQAAGNNIKIILAAQQNYYFTNSNYCINTNTGNNITCGDLNHINNSLHLNVVDQYYTYSCFSGNTPNSVRCVATSLSGSGTCSCNGITFSTNCTPSVCNYACTPVCPSSAACGEPDGCGGYCTGLCTTGYGCAAIAGSNPQDYQCETCISNCSSQCVDSTMTVSDLCGGTCAANCTGANKVCQSSTCVTCIPSCVGKNCGSNGCAGSCGNCAGANYCNASGVCAPCAQNCPLGCNATPYPYQPLGLNPACPGNCPIKTCNTNGKMCSANACVGCTPIFQCSTVAYTDANGCYSNLNCSNTAGSPHQCIGGVCTAETETCPRACSTTAYTGTHGYVANDCAANCPSSIGNVQTCVGGVGGVCTPETENCALPINGGATCSTANFTGPNGYSTNDCAANCTTTALSLPPTAHVICTSPTGSCISCTQNCQDGSSGALCHTAGYTYCGQGCPATCPPLSPPGAVAGYSCAGVPPGTGDGGGSTQCQCNETNATCSDTGGCYQPGASYVGLYHCNGAAPDCTFANCPAPPAATCSSNPTQCLACVSTCTSSCVASSVPIASRPFDNCAPALHCASNCNGTCTGGSITNCTDPCTTVCHTPGPPWYSSMYPDDNQCSGPGVADCEANCTTPCVASPDHSHCTDPNNGAACTS